MERIVPCYGSDEYAGETEVLEAVEVLEVEDLLSLMHEVKFPMHLGAYGE